MKWRVLPSVDCFIGSYLHEYHRWAAVEKSGVLDSTKCRRHRPVAFNSTTVNQHIASKELELDRAPVSQRRQYFDYDVQSDCIGLCSLVTFMP